MSGRTREQLQRSNQMQQRDLEKMAGENKQLRACISKILASAAHYGWERIPWGAIVLMREEMERLVKPQEKPCSESSGGLSQASGSHQASRNASSTDVTPSGTSSATAGIANNTALEAVTASEPRAPVGVESCGCGPEGHEPYCHAYGRSDLDVVVVREPFVPNTDLIRRSLEKYAPQRPERIMLAIADAVTNGDCSRDVRHRVYTLLDVLKTRANEAASNEAAASTAAADQSETEQNESANGDRAPAPNPLVDRALGASTNCLHLDRRCKSWEACARRLAIDSAKHAEEILRLTAREHLIAAGVDPDDTEAMRARIPESSTGRKR